MLRNMTFDLSSPLCEKIVCASPRNEKVVDASARQQEFVNQEVQLAARKVVVVK